MDVDTVIPAMIVEAGGGAVQIGILTAIMFGGSSFTQLIFAPLISNRSFKKPLLLAGINVRIVALLALGLIMLLIKPGNYSYVLWLIFLFITLFSLSGAFSNISYNDIFGKSVNDSSRKRFFSIRQVLGGSIILLSAFLAKKALTLAHFPTNYAYIFLIGGSILLLASGGFWAIKEVAPSTLRISGIRHFWQVMGTELRENRQLPYFLGFVNTQGIAVTLLPFVILYAKQTFHTTSAATGSFLVFKILGMVSAGLIVFLLNTKIKYNRLLYGNTALALLMAGIAFGAGSVATLKLLFVMGGVVYSLYSISMNGVLMEVSGNQNRALYTGFAGAGNILPALFPLAGGVLIKSLGFHFFIAVYLLIVATSLFFIYKIKCKK